MGQKTEYFGFAGIIAVILIFLFFILGFKGLMTGLGLILFLAVPFYLILNNFEMENDEKLIFSFFLGAGIFSSIAYWIGYFISFRIAIFLTLILLLLAAYLIKKLYKRRAISSS